MTLALLLPAAATFAPPASPSSAAASAQPARDTSNAAPSARLAHASTARSRRSPSAPRVPHASVAGPSKASAAGGPGASVTVRSSPASAAAPPSPLSSLFAWSGEACFVRFWHDGAAGREHDRELVAGERRSAPLAAVVAVCLPRRVCQRLLSQLPDSLTAPTGPIMKIFIVNALTGVHTQPCYPPQHTQTHTLTHLTDSLTAPTGPVMKSFITHASQPACVWLHLRLCSSC